jgi:hypothetical protein
MTFPFPYKGAKSIRIIENYVSTGTRCVTTARHAPLRSEMTAPDKRLNGSGTTHALSVAQAGLCAIQTTVSRASQAATLCDRPQQEAADVITARSHCPRHPSVRPGGLAALSRLADAGPPRAEKARDPAGRRGGFMSSRDYPAGRETHSAPAPARPAEAPPRHPRTARGAAGVPCAPRR